MKTLFRLFGTSCIVYILGCAGGTDTDALDFYGARTRTLISLILCTVCFTAANLCAKRERAKKAAARRRNVRRRENSFINDREFEISAEPVRQHACGINAECL